MAAAEKRQKRGRDCAVKKHTRDNSQRQIKESYLVRKRQKRLLARQAITFLLARNSTPCGDTEKDIRHVKHLQ